MQNKIPKGRFLSALRARRERANAVALQLIDESMRTGCSLPNFVAALALIVGSVATEMRVEAREGFYRRFPAAAYSAEARCEQVITASQTRH